MRRGNDGPAYRGYHALPECLAQAPPFPLSLLALYSHLAGWGNQGSSTIVPALERARGPPEASILEPTKEHGDPCLLSTVVTDWAGSGLEPNALGRPEVRLGLGI